jgi:hypothetical protein
LDHFVTSRIARATFGIESRPWFNSNNKEHHEWAHKAFVDAVCGEKFIAGGFAATLVRVRLHAVVRFDVLISGHREPRSRKAWNSVCPSRFGVRRNQHRSTSPSSGILVISRILSGSTMTQVRSTRLNTLVVADWLSRALQGDVPGEG